MPGRVWRSGSVQVIQNVRIIPPSLHPRSRLPEALTPLVAEVVYVPVFSNAQPSAAPVAVIEALLSAHSTESMLVANFISWVGAALTNLQVCNAAAVRALGPCFEAAASSLKWLHALRML